MPLFQAVKSSRERAGGIDKTKVVENLLGGKITLEVNEENSFYSEFII